MDFSLVKLTNIAPQSRIGGDCPGRHVRRGVDGAVDEHGLRGGAASVDPCPQLALLRRRRVTRERRRGVLLLT